MVKLIGNDGKIATSESSSTARLRQVKELELINESTLSFITTISDDLMSLQDIKNALKAEKNNPFNMHMEKGHANAQVRTDCQKLRGKELIHAREFGRRVVFFNPQVVRDVIAKTKDKVKLEAIKSRQDILNNLPRRDSYY